MSLLVVAGIVLDAAMLAFVAALVCAVARRWSAAATLASFVAIAGAAVMFFAVGRAFVARAIGEALSRAVLPLVVTCAGLAVREFARRRARESQNMTRVSDT